MIGFKRLRSGSMTGTQRVPSSYIAGSASSRGGKAHSRGWTMSQSSSLKRISRFPNPLFLSPRNNLSIAVKNAGIISSTAGGAISSNFSCSQISSNPQWANYQALFDGFAVRGLRLTITAYHVGDNTATTGLDQSRGNLVSYIDMDSSTPAGSVAAAFEFSTAKILAPRTLRQTRVLNIPADRRPRINATSSGFNTTVNDDSSIMLVGDGWGASLTAFYFELVFLAEFVVTK